MKFGSKVGPLDVVSIVGISRTGSTFKCTYATTYVLDAKIGELEVE